MREWKEYFIEDLADLFNHIRKPLSKMERADFQGLYPYYGASGVIDYVKEYLFDGNYVLISEDGENLKSRKTPIAFEATGKFWVNNHAHIVKGKKKYINRLLIYYFQNLDLSPFITGAVQPKLSKTNLLSIPIYLPETENEKRAIAGVLSSLDAKIDLLHRQNATLEGLAEVLWREWFHPEQVTGVKGEDDELLLADFIDINPKLSLKKGEKAPYLEMKNVQSTSANPSDWYYREYKGGTKFQNGDTLLARITPCLENGKTAYVQFLENNQIGWGSTEFLVLRTKAPYPNFCSYLLAKNEDFRSFAIKTMTGSSGRQRVQTDSLKNYVLGKPSNEGVQLMTEQLIPIEDKLKVNAQQIKTLEKLRDTLLPKLMSGEVRVEL